MNYFNIKISAIAYLAILLMGCQQFLAPRIGNTNIDTSCFIFAAYLYVYAITVGFRKNVYVFACILNCIWFAISITYLYSDLSRIIFSCFLLTLMFLLFNVRDVNLTHKNFKIYINWMLLYTVIALCIQLASGNTRDARTGFFDEPSFLGLVLFSASAGYLGCVLSERNLSDFIKFVVLFALAFSTLSMHVFSFFLTLTAYISFNVLRGQKVGWWFLGLLTIIVWWFFGYQFVNTDHFSQRLNIANPTNLSLLSWLRGLDQAIYASQNSFLLGFGPGSTGEFDFSSKYSELLSKSKLEKLNLADAYSAFFRFTIEIGLVMTILIVFLAFKIFLKGTGYRHQERSKDYIFILWFAFTLFIGVLIKEPTYSRSYVFVSVFLLGQCSIRRSP